MIRLRKLTIVVATMLQSKSYNGLQTTVPSFIYKPDIHHSDNEPFTLTIDLTWEHENSIVLTITVVTLVFSLYKYLRKRHRAMICLELTAGKE